MRKPKRLKSQVVAGLMAMLPTKTKSTTLPDLIALHPKTVWNSSGSRNGIAPTTSQNIELPLMAAPKVGMRSVRRLMSGAGVRSRCQVPRDEQRRRGDGEDDRERPARRAVGHDLAGIGDGAERSAGEHDAELVQRRRRSRSRCP